LKSPIFLPWLMTSSVITLLSVSIFLAHFYHFQNSLIEHERIIWRTSFYILTILLLPLTNLLRHIFLRLNQTMPLLDNADLEKTIKTRYILTVSVSMLLILIISSFGSVMFYLGDGFNTLHIFNMVAGLGIFLYRPKLNEYQQIQNALMEDENDD
jgi:O-antigen/teichoic acid export membrane protein